MVARREEKAAAQARQAALDNTLAPRIVVLVDGTIELWRGRTVLRMTKSQAREVRDLFVKLCE